MPVSLLSIKITPFNPLFYDCNVYFLYSCSFGMAEVSLLFGRVFLMRFMNFFIKRIVSKFRQDPLLTARSFFSSNLNNFRVRNSKIRELCPYVLVSIISKRWQPYLRLISVYNSKLLPCEWPACCSNDDLTTVIGCLVSTATGHTWCLMFFKYIPTFGSGVSRAVFCIL